MYPGRRHAALTVFTPAGLCLLAGNLAGCGCGNAYYTPKSSPVAVGVTVPDDCIRSLTGLIDFDGTLWIQAIPTADPGGAPSTLPPYLPCPNDNVGKITGAHLTLNAPSSMTWTAPSGQTIPFQKERDPQAAYTCE
jgi:hypothetical protein